MKQAEQTHTLPIYETFYAWQGEGCHQGRAAFFIRTFGCPLQCAWCDSAGTWHPDWIPERIERVTVEHLAKNAAATAANFTVITGGEPTLHDLQPLITAIKAARVMPIHLETSGAFPIRGSLDWVTLSPKWSKLPLRENVQLADELKIIVENENTISRWWAQIGADVRAQSVWLHPEWSQRNNPLVMNSISEWIKKHGGPFRAGYQIHRLYNVDALDKRARPSIPLGGNPALGS